MRRHHIKTGFIAAPGVLVPLTGFAGAGIADVAAEDPGLFMVMMIILLGVIAALIAFCAIVLVAALIFGFMIIAGTFTVSALVAWYRKSVSTGLRVFIYSTAIVLGSIAGALGGWMAARMFLQEYSVSLLVTGSSLTGAISGFLVARTFIFLSRNLLRGKGERRSR